MTATALPDFIVPLVLPVYPLDGTEHLPLRHRAARWILALFAVSSNPWPMADILCQFPHHDPEQFAALNAAILDLEQHGYLARDLYAGDIRPLSELYYTP